MEVSKEYLETPCQLQSPNNKLICVGKISFIGDNYIVLTKSTAEDFPPISFLSFVKGTIKHKSAGYKVFLASVTEATPTTIRLSSMVLLTDDERRGYFRIHMEEAAVLYLTDDSQTALDIKSEYEEAVMYDNKASAHPKRIEIKIKNISLSGLLLETNAFLQIGQHVFVELNTKRGTNLFMIAIRRRVESDTTASKVMELAGSVRSETAQYGCMIVEKNDRKMDDLCRTILEKQAAMIQKMKK